MILKLQRCCLSDCLHGEGFALRMMSLALVARIEDMHVKGGLSELHCEEGGWARGLWYCIVFLVLSATEYARFYVSSSITL
jgi:hypothetical protein